MPLPVDMPMPPGTRTLVYHRPVGGSFDIFDRVLDRAARGEFDAIIIYSASALGDDEETVEQNRARIEDAGLQLIIHAGEKDGEAKNV